MITSMSFEYYRNALHNYYLTDVLVKSKGHYVFVFTEANPKYDNVIESQFLAKAVMQNFEESPNKFKGTDLTTGYEPIRIGTFSYDSSRLLVVDSMGKVLVEDTLQPTWIDLVGEHPTQAGVVERLKKIQNTTFSVHGFKQGISQHIEGNEWKLIHKYSGEANDYKTLKNLELGFSDLDGFNLNDMYAVGGRGDVMHFDGNTWEKIPFPSNQYLTNVCCAGDGWVYISGQGGAIFKGKKNTWKQIIESHSTLDHRDLVWYRDRLYCTNDYGFWQIKDDQLSQVDVPAEITICCGHLSVADDVMLLGGIYGIAAYEDDQWYVIADLAEFRALVEKEKRSEEHSNE